MRTPRHALFAALGLLLGTAVPLAAQDFTIVVPVEISGLHASITQGRVSCYVSRFDPPSAASYAVVARGDVDFPLSGGAYTGDVTVPLGSEGAWGPAAGRSYQCGLLLRTPSGGAFWDAGQMSAEGGVYFFEEARLAPGMPSRFVVRGTLTP